MAFHGPHIWSFSNSSNLWKVYTCIPYLELSNALLLLAKLLLEGESWTLHLYIYHKLYVLGEMPTPTVNINKFKAYSYSHSKHKQVTTPAQC